MSRYFFILFLLLPFLSINAMEESDDNFVSQFLAESDKSSDVLPQQPSSNTISQIQQLTLENELLRKYCESLHTNQSLSKEIKRLKAENTDLTGRVELLDGTLVQFMQQRSKKRDASTQTEESFIASDKTPKESGSGEIIPDVSNQSIVEEVHQLLANSKLKRLEYIEKQKKFLEEFNNPTQLNTNVPSRYFYRFNANLLPQSDEELKVQAGWNKLMFRRAGRLTGKQSPKRQKPNSEVQFKTPLASAQVTVPIIANETPLPNPAAMDVEELLAQGSIEFALT